MDFSDNKPIYQQIAEGIMDSIQQDEFPSGARLPSVREYATKTGVNPNTVMRTYTWLQTHGMISMKRGIGYFVTDEAPKIIMEMRRSQFFDTEAVYFLKRLKQFGINPEELERLYREYLNSTE